MKDLKLKDRIIVALDTGDAESAKGLLDKLYPTIKIFKIGSQLFTSCGQQAVGMVTRKGGATFLDLKFHDIPHTVSGAVVSATKLGVDIFNLHACGGLQMMKSALEAAEETAKRLKIKRPIILGITVLTSTGKRDLEDLGIKKPIKEQVLFLAELVGKAGLDGVVASADEIEMIKKELGRDFIVLTPGIRPSWAAKNDQKRVATPKQAFERGADYIVIGRPITESKDPKAAAERIIGEIE